MTTLHMNVEMARATQKTMEAASHSIGDALANMQRAVNNLRNAEGWQGNSANEFFAEYDGLYSQLKNVQDNLLRLTTRLGAEINQWETTAAKLD